MNCDSTASTAKWSKSETVCFWINRKTLMASWIIVHKGKDVFLRKFQVYHIFLQLYLVKLSSTVSLKSLQFVLYLCCTSLECSVGDAVTSSLLMLICPTLRGPSLVRQNAEDHVSVKSLLRLSYFSVITPMIQLRSCIPQSGQARQGDRWLTGKDITMRREREYRERYEYLSRWHKRIL